MQMGSGTTICFRFANVRFDGLLGGDERAGRLPDKLFRDIGLERQR
jgi:hypothetical protein